MQVINNTIFIEKEPLDAELDDILFGLYANKSVTSITISKNLALNSGFTKKLGSLIQNKEIKIFVPFWIYEGSSIFEYEELKVLKENIKSLEANGSKVAFVEECGDGQKGYSFHEAVVASRRIDEIVTQIKNAKVDGEELSPLEKYLYAYIFVTDFVYKESGNGSTDEAFESRSVVRVLNGDKIVCVGYVSMLSEICKRLNIPLKPQFVVDNYGAENKIDEINHAGLEVYIKDEKYGVDGMFYSDPTQDSIDEEGARSVCHALIGFDELERIFDGKIEFKPSFEYDKTLIVGFINQIKNKPKVESGMLPQLASYILSVPEANEQFMKTLVDVVESMETENIQKNANHGLSEAELKEKNNANIKTISSLVLKQYSEWLDENDKKIKEAVAELYQYNEVTLPEIVEIISEYLPYYNLSEDELKIVDDYYKQQEYLNACLTYQEFKEKSEDIPPEVLHEALVTVLVSMGNGEQQAEKIVDGLFQNSVNIASRHWNLEKATSYFATEAKRILDLLNQGAKKE